MLDAFRIFGIQDTTTDLLVIKVSVSNSPTTAADNLELSSTASTLSRESIEKHLRSSVHGDPLNFRDKTFAKLCDYTKVKKAYKIATAPSSTNRKQRAANPEAESELQDSTTEVKSLERAILGAMALRGAT